jgi:hypothetical protein
MLREPLRRVKRIFTRRSHAGNKSSVSRYYREFSADRSPGS